jgi:streptomycin 6-kinase
VNLVEWDIHGMGRVLMAATSRVAQVTAHGQKAAVSICKPSAQPIQVRGGKMSGAYLAWKPRAKVLNPSRRRPW